jgi:hypothetical protein
MGLIGFFPSSCPKYQINDLDISSLSLTPKHVISRWSSIPFSSKDMNNVDTVVYLENVDNDPVIFLINGMSYNFMT